jgi:CheY-like chemotaxis protein
MNELSAYSFPSTVCLIDDDTDLLTVLVMKLKKGNFYRTSNEPLKAIEFLKNTHASGAVFPQPLDNTEQDDPNRYLVDFDLSPQLKYLENEQRFQEVSVVIVDYSMPEINGVDLMAQLKDKPFKKILLTGEADQGIAIRAFNAGLIDRYLSKNLDIFPLLNEYVAELQAQYFVERSAPIINFMTQQNQAFNQSALKALLHTITKTHQIVEYYLMNKAGSFLLVNAAGKLSYLEVQSEADLKEYTEIAVGNEAPAPIIASLKAYTKMPVFFSEADHQQAVEDWNLEPAMCLETVNGKLYYAVLDTLPEGFINQEKFVSLAAYNHPPI